MRHPWYAWLILGLTWATLTAIFFFVLGTVPNHGRWMRWVFGALPTVIVLPFVIAEARK